jgi:hypothetical protein
VNLFHKQKQNFLVKDGEVNFREKLLELKRASTNLRFKNMPGLSGLG